MFYGSGIRRRMETANILQNGVGTNSTAQRTALERRLPSLLSSQSGEAQKERGPLPEKASAKPVPAFNSSSITLTTPPAT